MSLPNPCTPTPSLPRVAAAVLLAAALGACSDDDDTSAVVPDGPDSGPQAPGGEPPEDGPAPDDAGIVTLDVDATAGGFGAEPDDPADRWAYLDLDGGRVLDLDDAAAETSSDWDIAFRRVAVRLNGGVSGPGEVRGGIADAQLDFYDEAGEPDVDVFVAATAEAEHEAIARAVDTRAIDYVEESELGAIVGDGGDLASSWWIYDPAAFSVTANPAVRYAVRGADGASYAKLQVTDIQQTERQITVELELQPSGQTAFDPAPVVWTAAIGADGGALCYDFDTVAEVDCEANAAGWDLQAEVTLDGRAWNLWSNGGVRGTGASGASFGPFPGTTAVSFAAADDIPLWNADTTGGVFDEYLWYGYDLRDENRIWPNYRVYAIDTGESVWKLQMLRYYDEAGTSGMLRLRYAAIDADDGMTTEGAR